MENQKKVIVGLLIVILLFGLYFGYDKGINKYLDGKKTEAFNSGVQEVIKYIVLEASACKVIPLNFNNQTVNMVSVDCLQTQ